jgi:hypothetical protein
MKTGSSLSGVWFAITTCLFGTISSAHAVVTYTFEGTVNQADNMGGIVKVGETWTFTVSVSETPFSGSVAPGFDSAIFPQVGISSMSFSAGLSGTFSGGGPLVSHTPTFDFLDFSPVSANFPSIGGNVLNGALFFLEAQPGNVLSSDALPLTIDPTQWNKISFSLLWLAHFAPDSPFLALNVTSVRVADSGSALLLLASALGVLAAFREFRRAPVDK